MEGHTDHYRLGNTTLTAIRYQDEILRSTVRSRTGAVGPGFLLMDDNVRPHATIVCKQFMEYVGTDTIDWLPHSPDLTPIEHLWDILF